MTLSGVTRRGSFEGRRDLDRRVTSDRAIASGGTLAPWRCNEPSVSCSRVIRLRLRKSRRKTCNEPSVSCSRVMTPTVTIHEVARATTVIEDRRHKETYARL